MPGTNTRYIAKRAATLAIVSSTAAACFVTASDSTKPCILYFPTVPTLQTILFDIRAWGRFTTGTSGTALATLQYGTSATAASNTDIAALGANTVATNGNWSLHVELQWDSTSQILRGWMEGISGDTPTMLGPIVNTATKSSVDLTVAGGSGVGLVMSAKFGTSNASNVAFLDGFTMAVL